LPEGKKSLAFKVLLQDTHKTLTDEEVDAAVAALIKKAETCGAILRT
jgi:phenylalanyl-tRNA synthetase beta chain